MHISDFLVVSYDRKIHFRRQSVPTLQQIEILAWGFMMFKKSQSSRPSLSWTWCSAGPCIRKFRKWSPLSMSALFHWLSDLLGFIGLLQCHTHTHTPSFFLPFWFSPASLARFPTAAYPIPLPPTSPSPFYFCSFPMQACRQKDRQTGQRS